MFDNYFEVLLADTVEAKRKHYQIRYEVYCDEMGFEDKSQFLNEQEWDKWDKSSVHFIVRHKYTGQWVGAMRLVSHDSGALPVNEHTILKDMNDNVLSIGSSDVELSRLCLIKEIRRRPLDSAPPYGLLNEKQPVNKADNIEPLFDRRINLSIIWGLFRAAADYSEQNSIDSWYFLTNKALARVIGREGFILHNVGASCEHAGKRYPFKMKMDEILSQVSSSEMASNVQAKSYRMYSDYKKDSDYEYVSALA